jgi:hypothetical protein
MSESNPNGAALRARDLLDGPTYRKIKDQMKRRSLSRDLRRSDQGGCGRCQEFATTGWVQSPMWLAFAPNSKFYSEPSWKSKPFGVNAWESVPADDPRAGPRQLNAPLP